MAVLSAEEAFAFSSESYAHNKFGNLAWRLGRGTYRIAVHVHGSSVDHEQVFKLEYLSDDFAQFRLQNNLTLLQPHLDTFRSASGMTPAGLAAATTV